MSTLKRNEMMTLEEPLTEKELYDSLKSMPNEKSPGNDGLTKEFYEFLINF